MTVIASFRTSEGDQKAEAGIKIWINVDAELRIWL